MYSYPLTSFSSRITVRDFGQKISSDDTKKLPCGFPFTGYHTGVDLEIFSSEQNIPVPVHALADGKVIIANNVKGYGGLIVLRHNTFTSLYGHLDLTSTQIKINDQVKKGQFLANLGAACSIQTDGERKHLHFAIHRGQEVDIRGYVSNLSEISAWIDPKEVF